MVSQSNSMDFILRVLMFLIISFCIIGSSDIAFAGTTTTTTADPIGTQLCNVVKILGGTTAKAIAIVALMSVAVGLFMGKINWGVALTTAAGVIIMFGAGKIIGFLAGGSLDATTCVPAA